MTKTTAKPDNACLARRLREIRLLAGTSQDALAKKTGIRRATISKLEDPEGRNVRLGTLQRLAVGLGVDVLSFFSSALVPQDPMAAEAPNRFRVNLRSARLRKGVSQEDLSELAGFFRTYVGKVERTDVDVALNDVMRLADTLGVTVLELLAKQEPT
ncbi:helix-turn-helix transcriptional regulator [Burkholderia pseudomallei]|nr:helix-turn-helix transcriptional regulator [Burkholderia pseudomallei]